MISLMYWQQIVTDAALLKRQKKMIEELQAKLDVHSPSSFYSFLSLFSYTIMSIYLQFHTC